MHKQLDESGRKRRRRKKLSLAGVALAAVAAGAWALWSLIPYEIKNFLQPLVVTVHNESSGTIVLIESGLLMTDATDRIGKKVESGSSARFRPDLALSGEGAVYLRFTDARGRTSETGVCGYTEYLSGSSTVTITDGNAVVEEDCW